MHLTEPQLRTVLLAQAVEQADSGRTLVSAGELEEATRTAVAAARQRGVPRVEAGDVLLDRATTVAERASARNATVAALLPGPASARWRWLATGLPLAALLLGLALDRVANAHRVDLLSPPLLVVLAWNLAVYLGIGWQASRNWRRGQRVPGARPWLHGLRHLRWPSARGRGLGARIAADFQARWWAHAGSLVTLRMARLLHLCAAAWGAGIALSLVLRGLVVRYQFGWESTFLDAAQVHAIVSVLFWPITAAFGVAPMTAAEIAATENFAGQGAAGARWVWMYVGLLTLVVVLPRLLLAAVARWREGRWLRRHCHVDLTDAAFDPLRQSLPGDLLIGLMGPQEWQLPEPLAQQGSSELHSPQGDRLRWLNLNPDVANAATAPAVDAVIAWNAAPTAGLPASWQAAPALRLHWEDFGAGWVRGEALFAQLQTVLPAERHAALERLRAQWAALSGARFDEALQALARHLRACVQLWQQEGGEAAAARYAELVQALDATLVRLHGPTTPAHSDDGSGPAAAASLGSGSNSSNSSQLPAPRRGDGRVLAAVGTSAGAAAGAAAGAKAGALIDMGTGGLTLGAGTALGALVGGASAWVLGGLRRKEDRQEVLRHAAEAALSHYLVSAHQGRLRGPGATALADRWRAEVVATVAAHDAELAAALRSAPAGAPADAGQALPALLRRMLLGVMERSLGPIRT